MKKHRLTNKLPAYAGPDAAGGESESLSILPRWSKITNSYTIKLPAFAGPDAASGEFESLSVLPRWSKITNSYTIKLPAYAGALRVRRC